MSVPIIEPMNVRQYEFKQSKYEMADKLPFHSIVVSASQGGKGILIQNLILNIYRGCLERIYIVSPTAHIDEAYKEVIRYIEEDLKVNKDVEPFLFDEYDAPSLQKIIDTQHGVIDYQKKRPLNKLFSCLIVIDDFAEDKQFMRYSKILHGLILRVRYLLQGSRTKEVPDFYNGTRMIHTCTNRYNGCFSQMKQRHLCARQEMDW